MPFKGWRSKYNAENKNYIKSSSAQEIMKYLKVLSDKTDKEIVVIDTISSIMSDKEMSERKKKGFDKWMDYAGEIYDLFALANSEELRENLIVIFTGHTETYQDANFEYKQRLLTGGTKLTKLNLEGKLTYTLYTEVEFEDGHPTYSFVTQTDGTNTARSPEGCFEYRIPNDLEFVINSIKEYENAE